MYSDVLGLYIKRKDKGKQRFNERSYTVQARRHKAGGEFGGSVYALPQWYMLAWKKEPNKDNAIS